MKTVLCAGTDETRCGACEMVLVSFAMPGKIPLTLGVAGHEGSTVIVVMNSLRLLFGGRK